MATQSVMEKETGSYGGKAISCHGFVTIMDIPFIASVELETFQSLPTVIRYGQSSVAGWNERRGSQHHIRENDSSVSKIDRLIMWGTELLSFQWMC